MGGAKSVFVITLWWRQYQAPPLRHRSSILPAYLSKIHLTLLSSPLLALPNRWCFQHLSLMIRYAFIVSLLLSGPCHCSLSDLCTNYAVARAACVVYSTLVRSQRCCSQTRIIYVFPWNRRCALHTRTKRLSNGPACIFQYSSAGKYDHGGQADDIMFMVMLFVEGCQGLCSPFKAVRLSQVSWKAKWSRSASWTQMEGVEV
jgi:hypothetical protein